MKELYYAAALFAALLVFGLAGFMWQSARDDREMYYRRMSELRQEVSELRGRLECVENIGISIDLRDHTGIWFVADVRGE